MKRYDWERYTKTKRNADPEGRYYIFDRLAGSTLKIATVYDVADAEIIVNALNGEVNEHNNVIWRRRV
jgi:hypothetical protein